MQTPRFTSDPRRSGPSAQKQSLSSHGSVLGFGSKTTQTRPERQPVVFPGNLHDCRQRPALTPSGTHWNIAVLGSDMSPQVGGPFDVAPSLEPSTPPVSAPAASPEPASGAPASAPPVAVPPSPVADPTMH